VTGTTTEDRALQWLVEEDKLGLEPNSKANQTQLRLRYALLTVAFLKTLDGSFVFEENGWQLCDETSECDCNNAWFLCYNGLVTTIGIQENVIGTLPADLCWLTGLLSLTMSKCELTGTLPTQLGWLTDITYFDMAEDSFTGTIPGGGLRILFSLSLCTTVLQEYRQQPIRAVEYSCHEIWRPSRGRHLPPSLSSPRPTLCSPWRPPDAYAALAAGLTIVADVALLFPLPFQLPWVFDGDPCCLCRRTT
jgi:hypothetical protein